MQVVKVHNLRMEYNDRKVKFMNIIKVPLNSKHVVSIIEDLTEKKSYLAELENYRNAIDASAIVSFSDPKGKIIFTNDKFCELSGYSREELIGNNHSLLKSGLHAVEVYQQLWKTINSGNVWQNEICNKKKNGELYWVYSTIIPSIGIDGKVEKFISIRFDITEMKIAKERIIQADKLSTLGEMAAGIFHEINNPLAILKSKTKLLQRYLQNPDLDITKLEVGLNILNENIDRISKITRGLRSYSRNADNDPFETIDVLEIIQDSLVLCADKINKHNVVVLKKINKNEFYISCRKSEITQVFLNLINNSIDAIENLS